MEQSSSTPTETFWKYEKYYYVPSHYGITPDVLNKTGVNTIMWYELGLVFKTASKCG